MLASLERKLSDSASLRYLRRTHFVSRAQRGKARLLRQKTKRDTRKGISFCLSMGDKKDIFPLFCLGLNCRAFLHRLRDGDLRFILGKSFRFVLFLTLFLGQLLLVSCEDFFVEFLSRFG